MISSTRDLIFCLSLLMTTMDFDPFLWEKWARVFCSFGSLLSILFATISIGFILPFVPNLVIMFYDSAASFWNILVTLFFVVYVCFKYICCTVSTGKCESSTIFLKNCYFICGFISFKFLMPSPISFWMAISSGVFWDFSLILSVCGCFISTGSSFCSTFSGIGSKIEG